MAARDQAAAAKDLRRAVAAQLSDAPVRLKAHWLPRLGADLRAELGAARRLARSKGTRVVFWCDLTGSDDVYLYLSDRDGGRLLVRQVPQTAGGARAESVAIIVGSSVRAFLRSAARAGPTVPGARRRFGGGRAVAMAPARPAARRTAPGAEAGGGQRAGGPGDPAAAAGAAAAGEGSVPTLQQPGGPRPTRLSLDLSYALDTYNGDNAPVHGASIGLAYRFHPIWSTFLAYRVVQPINGVLPDIAEATLQRHPISVGARLHHRMGRFEVGGALALVVDYLSTEAREAADSGSNFVKAGPDGYWQVLAGAELRGAYSPVRRLWICFALGAELIIYSSQFAVNIPSEPEPVPIGELEPWFLQPYVRLGLRVDLY